MIDGPPTALLVVAAVGCGLVGGVFFAFSSFVMPALRRLRPEEGIAAMQAINVTAVTFSFMTALFGTAALRAVLAVWALIEPDGGRAGFQLAGAVVYLAGTIGLTIGFHVPRNDALAGVDARGPGADEAWTRFQSQWTAGNHVRTAAGLAAALLLAYALAAPSE